MDNSIDWTDQDVLKWVDTAEELTAKCAVVCGDLISLKYDIAQTVEKLGPILTSPEVGSRRKGVQFLTLLLSHIPADFLPENQLKFILAFYNDRLRDHHSLVPFVIAGVQTLSQMAHAAEEDVLRLLFTILGGSVITCQSQQREERSKIFDLIIWCSDKYYETLMERRPEFVQGVINAVEGERDPRNLVKLFDFMPRFVERFPLEHWAEEMFEVFACYYPIDFYPSASDPNAITRDGLAKKLDDCLLGCRDFIEPALVLALEKLETELKVAKLDSLLMIRNCALKFGCKEIEQRFDNIWMGLKQELMPGQNDDVIRAGLEAVSAIVRQATEEPIRTNILTVIFNSIAISMCDVNLRLFYPAVRIAHAVGNATPEAAAYIGDKVAPIFLRQLINCDEENGDKKRTLLGLLKDLAAIANEKNCLNALDKEILSQIETVFLSCLSDDREGEEGATMKVIGYFGLMEIARETKPETRKIVFQSLLGTLRSGTRDGKIPIAACVTRFVRDFKGEVVREFVTPIVSESAPVTEKNSDKIFRTLCTLIGPCDMNDPNIYKYLLSNIFNFTDVSLNLDDEMEGDQHSRILLVLLACLNNLLSDKANVHVAKALCETHNLVPLLMSTRDQFRGDSTLNQLSTLLMHVVSGQAVEQQSTIIDEYLPLLRVSRGNDLYFINGLLSRCSNDITLVDTYEALILELVQVGLTGGSSNKIKAVDHLLCFLLNRNYPAEVALDRVVELALTTIQQSIAESGQGIRTLAWVTKGLLTRGHPKAEHLVLKIIHALRDENLSSAAADAFEVLAQQSEFYLPNERLFYKQKLFDLVCKHLIPQDGGQLDTMQMKGLSRVLGELSPLVLRMHLGRVGPILFRCLDHDDTQTVHTSLKLFFRLIDTDEKFCQEHLQYLIPQFVKLSLFKGNLHIRMLALRCLLAVCKFPTYVLIPFKQEVLYSTVAATDDHKRLVRAAAVEMRTRWFLIDSPIKEK